MKAHPSHELILKYYTEGNADLMCILCGKVDELEKECTGANEQVEQQLYNLLKFHKEREKYLIEKQPNTEQEEDNSSNTVT